MMNFDYLKDIPELQSLYGDCRDAEQYQRCRPEDSATAARRALEKWVKIIYLLNTWEIPARSSLLELTTFEPFQLYVGEEMLRRIHYIRKTGNIGAHGGQVTKAQSFFCVLNLYDTIGAFLKSVGRIEDYTPFDKSLIPNVVMMTAVTQDGQTLIQNDHLEQLAKTPAQPMVVTPSADAPSEAETRRLYIDIMLAEAGWEVLEQKGALLAGKACIEVELPGMPNNSEIGYADYVLFSDNMTPLAVIEAKRTTKDPLIGKHQAALYAHALEKKYGVRPIVYYTNGFTTYVQDGIYPDRTVLAFHTQQDLELMLQKRSRRNITDLRINEGIAGRDYQIQAVHSICHHLNNKHRRGLLVMATGTGKTRVSISLTEILMRNNWAKNILFLADRRSLVKQAARNYAKLLPSVSTTVLSENDTPDLQARIMFSTYQTMIRYIDTDKKVFSIGRFDLIIIDEAHRSVFGKYGAIFDYFDALLIGLTATPREDVDRSTYSLLDLEEGEPNFSYELDQAINDHNLVGYRAYLRSSKIMTQGAKYDDLSSSEKEQLEQVWEHERAIYHISTNTEYQRDIQGSEIYRYLFNIDTIDQVLQDLMENGLKIQDGNTLGKTIIFACNHQHAQLIVDRFHALYPQLGDDYCVLIDNQVNYGQDLIDIFSTPRNEAQKHIQIVVSVDMMDTGVDVPDCLNLVFFKQVHSKIKFNQMIGRGTRLCPNIFGQGQDKQEFLVFDYGGNFEYFNSHPNGAEAKPTPSLNQRLFSLRLDLAVLLQDAEYQACDYTKNLCEQLKDTLYEQVLTLNEAHISVRKHWHLVTRYKKQENWVYVSEIEAQQLSKKIAPLIFSDDTDFAAKRFDVVCLLMELSLIDSTIDGSKPMERIRVIAHRLEKKASIPQVMMCMPTIQKVQTAAFWESIHTNAEHGLDNLERIRVELRELMQYIGADNDTFTIDLKDVITDGGQIGVQTLRTTYKQRVLDYLEENIQSPVLQKIYQLEQLSETDIRELERIFWQELGTKEEYEQTYLRQERYKLYGGHIAAFLRSVIGIDRDLAKQKYIELIQGEVLTPEQEEYLNDILNYVCQNGDITRETMAQQPFCEFPWMDVFHERLTALVQYVDTIHQRINIG